MSQHKEYRLSAVPQIHVECCAIVEVFHRLVNYGDGDRDEGAFVVVTPIGESKTIHLNALSIETFVGAIKGAQKAADEYNDMLERAKRRVQKGKKKR